MATPTENLEMIIAHTIPNFDEARFLAACGVERDANGFINFPAR